ncbi:MAG: lamin tail domain-containing protein [Chloroflexi bacterium]|nr:lamin tail domain-containing protein [Chloroflexota bacterium]
MKFLKKTLPFILINILISALTVLAVLFIWDRVQQKKLSLQTPPIATQPVQNTTSNPEEPNKQTASKAPLASNFDDVDVSIELVSGFGDLNLEYLIIKNKGDTKFSLQDWSLRGSEQKSIPIESDIMLNPGGSLKIYSKEGTDSALTLYLNSQQAYWKSGITVTLRDPNQVERARYVIP